MAGFETIPVKDASNTNQDMLFYRDSAGRLVPVTRLEGATLEVPQMVIKEPIEGSGPTAHVFSESMRGFGISNDGSADLQFFVGSPVNLQPLLPDPASWEQGTIAGLDGSEDPMSTSPYRIRTVSIIPVSGLLAVAWDGSFRVMAHTYDSAGQWIAGGVWVDSPVTLVFGAGVAGVKLLLSYVATATINTSVIPGVNLRSAPGAGITVKPGEVFEGQFPSFQNASIAADGAWRAFGLGEP